MLLTTDSHPSNVCVTIFDENTSNWWHQEMHKAKINTMPPDTDS